MGNELQFTSTVPAPASATSTGTTGQEAYDASYYYRCIATNVWVRTPLSTWVTPFSLQFSGSPSDNIEMAAFSGFVWPASVTIEFWTKGQPTNSDSPQIMSQAAGNSGASDPALNVIYDSNRDLYVRVANSGTSYSISGGGDSRIPDSTGWHHFAWTFDGTTHKSWIDGVLNFTIVNPALSLATQALSLFIGAAGGLSNKMTGFRISKILRYTTGFSPTLANTTTVDANTELCLKFTEGSGFSVADSSGHGRNGVINGSLTWDSDVPA